MSTSKATRLELERLLRLRLIQHAMPDSNVSITELTILKKDFWKEVGWSELNRVVRESQLAAAKICLGIKIPFYKPKAIEPSPELAKWLETRKVLKKIEGVENQRKKEGQGRIFSRRITAYCK